MCRLVAVVANTHVHHKHTLRTAPRSLAQLSLEHPHGWGIGLHCPSAGWKVEKNTLCAQHDDTYHTLAEQAYGQLLIAHVRYRTVGETRIENTHPFVRGRWLFAHNGTVKHLEFLKENTPKHRLDEIEGGTDSELLFAYILGQLDRISHPSQQDEVIRATVQTLQSRQDFGWFNFLLSDGVSVYAHRLGKTLFVRQSEAMVEIASEPFTPGDWLTVQERQLLKVSLPKNNRESPTIQWIQML